LCANGIAGQIDFLSGRKGPICAAAARGLAFHPLVLAGGVYFCQGLLYSAQTAQKSRLFFLCRFFCVTVHRLLSAASGTDCRDAVERVYRVLATAAIGKKDSTVVVSADCHLCFVSCTRKIGQFFSDLISLALTTFVSFFFIFWCGKFQFTEPPNIGQTRDKCAACLNCESGFL
jgi:hypothetical protein